jgi:hypothetical protein
VQTIILSGSVHETYAWADAQERHRRTVRHVPHAASLQGRAYDGIVELPSFAQRRDRHAVMAMLKRLRRALPNIPYSLDEDWVMPERPKPVDKKLVDPSVFVFSNMPEPQPVDEVPDEPEPEVEEQLVEAIATTEHVQDILEEAKEAKTDRRKLGTDELNTPKPTDTAESPLGHKPKRKGRRTNEQKAYDEALAAWETNGGSAEAVQEAREALAKRHPDDERLTNIEIRPRPDNDLDF